jgi:cell division protein FtsB
MGLSNPQLLEPWLKLLNQHKVPLSGIISLPLLSESVVKRFDSAHRCVILVSQQVPSNLRQSVFLDGKLILSRLVPIASFYQGDYAKDVLRDVESTQRYLVSQRVIDRSDVVDVHVLTNQRHLEKLRASVTEDSEFDYHIHEINQVLQEEKIEVPEEQDFSSALFCFHAIRGLYVNHYAQRAERKYFHHHVAAMAGRFIAVALLAVALGLFGSSLVKSWLYDDSIEEMKLLQQKYESKYKQLSLTRAGSDVSTTMMQNVVKTVDQLEKGYQQRPQAMMTMISQQISLYDSMRVNEYHWFVAPASDARAAREVNWLKDTPRRRGARRDRRRAKGEKGLFEVAVVSGEILDFDGNYRYALSAVADLEDAMRVSGWYDEVVVLKRPLDVESEKQLSGELGAGKRREKGRAEFTIRVVRKVKTDEK